MPLDALLAILLQDSLDNGSLGCRDRRVEQSPSGAPHQVEARPDDVGGHGKRGQRVQPESARVGDEADSHQDTGRGPDVCKQVLRVGFEGDRVVHLPGLAQFQRHAQVDQRRDDGAAETPPDRDKGHRVEEPLECGDDDAHGGEKDQAAFRAAREVLDLRLAVGVLFMGLTSSDRQGSERDDRRDQVGEGLERV